MIRRSLLLIMASLSYAMCAQVGINTKNPQASAILDVVPDLKSGHVGVLFPKLTTIQRQGLNASTLADGLLVFDTDLQLYMYFLKGQWYGLNAVKTTVSNSNAQNDTTSTHTGKAVFQTQKTNSPAVEVRGDLALTGKLQGNLQASGTLSGSKVYGEGTMPAGAIVMWSGDPLQLPQGWALCDGSNGTPDLRSRFVVGYDPRDAEYAKVGKIGPEYVDADHSTKEMKDTTIWTNYVYQVSNYFLSDVCGIGQNCKITKVKSMPGGEGTTQFNLTFEGVTYNYNDSVFFSKGTVTQIQDKAFVASTLNAKKIKLSIDQMPSHNHTGTTTWTGNVSHQHYILEGDQKYLAYDDATYHGNFSQAAANVYIKDPTDLANFGEGFDGPKYSGSVKSGSNLETHKHGIDNSGSSQPFDNRPPYYVLAYIIKLSF